MDWLISRYTVVARTLASMRIFAIIILSVVPADDRPVSGVGRGRNTLPLLPWWARHLQLAIASH